MWHIVFPTKAKKRQLKLNHFVDVWESVTDRQKKLTPKQIGFQLFVCFVKTTLKLAFWRSFWSVMKITKKKLQTQNTIYHHFCHVIFQHFCKEKLFHSKFKVYFFDIKVNVRQLCDNACLPAIWWRLWPAIVVWSTLIIPFAFYGNFGRRSRLRTYSGDHVGDTITPSAISRSNSIYLPVVFFPAK